MVSTSYWRANSHILWTWHPCHSLPFKPDSHADSAPCQVRTFWSSLSTIPAKQSGQKAWSRSSSPPLSVPRRRRQRVSHSCSKRVPISRGPRARRRRCVVEGSTGAVTVRTEGIGDIGPIKPARGNDAQQRIGTRAGSHARIRHRSGCGAGGVLADVTGATQHTRMGRRLRTKRARRTVRKGPLLRRQPHRRAGPVVRRTRDQRPETRWAMTAIARPAWWRGRPRCGRCVRRLRNGK